MKKLILTLVSMSSWLAFSEPVSSTDHVVSFDEVSIAEGKLAYGWDQLDLRPRPDLSEFQVSYFRFLSNGLGERFALVTFSKENGILRVVDKRDVVGILANGERLYPTLIEGETEIGDQGSVLLHFGPHKFPLVDLETRNE